MKLKDFKPTALPDKFKFLYDEHAPNMLVEALKLYGLKEVDGAGDNPMILEMAQYCGFKQYQHDSTAWCGLFMSYIASKCEKPLPNSPLWARNWLNFGVSAPTPKLGDVLVFSRDEGGHVGMYVAEDDNVFYVLAGNQNNEVCIVPIKKNRFLGARHFYSIAQPANCRPIYL